MNTRNRWENRFISVFRVVARDAEVAQEHSIPRKRSRIDAVYSFDQAPAIFGAMREVLSERAVALEHLSRPSEAPDVARASFIQRWLYMERADRSEAPPWLLELAREPLAVIVADGVRAQALMPYTWLSETTLHGVYATDPPELGGVLLIDTTAVRRDEHMTFWRWLEGPRNPANASRKLAELLGDSTVPIFAREQLMEAIMDGRVHTTGDEKKSAYQRAKDEGREEGRAEANAKERETLLNLIARLAPDKSDKLARIQDLQELRRAVEDALSSPSSR